MYQACIVRLFLLSSKRSRSISRRKVGYLLGMLGSLDICYLGNVEILL